jgi:threonine dehydratase
VRPGIRVIGVEPELAGETAESLHRGELVTWPVEQTYRTMADGVRTHPSELTFAHIQSYVDDIVTVPEERIAEAVGVLAHKGRLVVEPSGALPMAAHLHGVLPAGSKVLVLTGGNLEPASFRAMI